MRSVAPKWIGVGDRDPLTGLRVLITGSEVQASALERDLRRQGAEPARLPTIRIAPAADQGMLGAAVERAVAGEVDWVVLTSANAVAPLVEQLKGRSLSADVAVVGERTAEALAGTGITPRLVSRGFGAEALVAALQEAGVAGSRVLCLLSDRARPTLVDGLRALGANVDVATAYRTEAVMEIEPLIRDRIRAGQIDAITFASPSAVTSFRSLVGADLPALSGAAFVAIGPTTERSLREAGLPVHAVAGEQDAGGFIDALRTYLGEGV
jgi:uroporphyrinogen III methyltransferase/synthase